MTPDTPADLAAAIERLTIYSDDVDKYADSALTIQHVADIRTLLAAVKALPQWLPIDNPPSPGQFVLMAGQRSDGKGWWRDVGVYRGRTEAGHDFVDKYSADSHPSHWQPLPPLPASTPDGGG